MNILITGGAGYLGSVITRNLLENHNVTVMDNLMYNQTSLVDLFRNTNFKFIYGDVRDYKLLIEQVMKHDVIIPLAGIVGLSGAITTSSDLGQQAKNSTPILLVHGEDDQVLPARLSVEASETLMELGIPVDLHIIPDLRHSIDSRVISIVTDFLLKVFS